jgi:hypothetical protein
MAIAGNPKSQIPIASEMNDTLDQSPTDLVPDPARTQKDHGHGVE